MAKSQIKEQALYRDILRGAFEITWHRRELLGLGILASFLMMNGGAFEFIVRAIYKISAGNPYSGAPQFIKAIVDGIGSAETTTQISVFLTAILLAGVFALIAIVGVAASGGLFTASSRYALKKKVTTREAFASGMNKLGPLLLTQIFGRITIFAAFSLAAIGVYTQTGNPTASYVSIALFVAFAVTALFVSFVMAMTNAGIIIDKKRWVNAAHDALSFLHRHWLVSIEMIFMIFVIALITAIAIGVAITIALIPFTLILLAISALHFTGGISALMFIFELVVLAIIFAGSAALAVFGHTAWSILYIRLSNTGAVPKLERLWQMLKKARPHVRSRKF